MAFDTWSAWGIRKNDKDYIYVNIDNHNVSELGNKFAHFIVEQYKLNQLKEINEIADKNQNSIIVKPETLIDKDMKKFIKKLLVNNKLNTQESSLINYWGAFFAQEAFNPNFLLSEMKYRIDFSNYLLLSDITCCAYIFNLDTNHFEIYFGFNEERGLGRYGKRRHPEIVTDFFGVNLVKEIALEELIKLSETDTNWNLNYFIGDNERLTF